MELKALIFDVDGTLSETEETHRQAFNRAFTEEGLDWHWDRSLYRDLLQVTGGKERIVHYVEAHRPEADKRRLASGPLSTLHQRKTAHYTELVKSGAAQLRPGIKRLIDEARAARLKVAIATTTTVPAIKALLEATIGEGAMDEVDAVAAGDMVTAKKPAPDVYLLALEKLGVPASACIAFEDSENGLNAAVSAGIACVVTPSINLDDKDFSDALACVTVLGDDDAPAEYLSGAALDGDRVTIDQLRKWHAAHGSGRVEAA